MVKFYNGGFETAPVRVTINLTRREYEEAEQAAEILGYGTVEIMVHELILETIEELKRMGYRIKPFWERD